VAVRRCLFSVLYFTIHHKYQHDLNPEAKEFLPCFQAINETDGIETKDFSKLELGYTS